MQAPLPAMIELEKEKMDSVRMLAETNLLISEAKEKLFNLKKDEESYLLERDRKALNKIQVIFDESSEIVKGIRSNYQEVNGILKDAQEMTSFLVELHENLTLLIGDFETNSKEWEKHVKVREKEFDDLKKEIKKDKIIIENDKKSLEQQKLLLAETEKRLRDERGTLDRAIERLKKGKI